jgi:hypothetical protein
VCGRGGLQFARCPARRNSNVETHVHQHRGLPRTIMVRLAAPSSITNLRPSAPEAIDVFARKRMFDHFAPPVRAISRERTVSFRSSGEACGHGSGWPEGPLPRRTRETVGRSPILRSESLIGVVFERDTGIRRSAAPRGTDGGAACYLLVRHV